MGQHLRAFPDHTSASLACTSRPRLWRPTLVAELGASSTGRVRALTWELVRLESLDSLLQVVEETVPIIGLGLEHRHGLLVRSDDEGASL